MNTKEIKIIAFIGDFLATIAIIMVTVELGMVFYLIYILLSSL